MVLDAAHCKTQDNAYEMPLCCYYNLQAAIQWLQQREHNTSAEMQAYDLDCLLQSEKRYHKNWVDWWPQVRQEPVSYPS